MADESKRPIIIVKKIIDGGHGGHGGAWKVAYADFVTAMMCFFLVLWLLGADEEVKLQISSYFNNPTSAWRPSLKSEDVIPLGSKTGAGQHVLNGLEGQLSEDVVRIPNTQHYMQPEETRDYGETTKDIVEHQTPAVDINIELLKFSVPEQVLFKPGTDELSKDANKYLARIGSVIRKNRATVLIKGFTSPAPALEGASPEIDDYEFTVSRVVAISKWLVKNNFVETEKISPEISDRARTPAGDARRVLKFVMTDSRVELILSLLRC